MPSTSEILAGLARIANDQLAFAIVWHVVLATLIIALVLGWRPRTCVVANALSVPLASVSAFAWMYGNPFNGTVFGVLALLVALLGLRAPEHRIAAPAGWPAALGGVMLTYAWLYPHFVEGHSPVAYLYAAPLGLVPCPTLALVIGLALVTGVYAAGRAWTLVVATAGLAYALFGALRLGVWVDLGLLIGAVGLLATTIHRRSFTTRLPRATAPEPPSCSPAGTSLPAPELRARIMQTKG